MGELTVAVADDLRFLLSSRHRGETVRARYDGIAPLAHVIESLGVPLPEVGDVAVNGASATLADRPAAGNRVWVGAVWRPQPLPAARFVLDVHFGALARYLRLVGLDTAYPGDRSDDALIDQANAQHRVLLTQDHALLCRRALWFGAYARGAGAHQHLADVLDRFAPRLAPWTRCTACNGFVRSVPKRDVEQVLEPGTRRTYDQFSQCASCDRVYWRGAHREGLESIVDEAWQVCSRRASSVRTR